MLREGMRTAWPQVECSEWEGDGIDDVPRHEPRAVELKTLEMWEAAKEVCGGLAEG